MPSRARATWKLEIRLIKTPPPSDAQLAIAPDVRATVAIETTEGNGLDDLQTALAAVRDARAKRDLAKAP